MSRLEVLLEEVRTGKLDTGSARKEVQDLFFTDLGHTVIDTDRQRRTGHGEVVYCAGKSTKQIRDILNFFSSQECNVLGTSMRAETYEELVKEFSFGIYDRDAKLFSMMYREPEQAGRGTIAVVSAGTSDHPVAEEAARTIEFYGHRVKRINDVGVAGIHRLLSRLDDIRESEVVIVVAGMEGALGSVVGGLVDVPVIAVPTSVGYGASFQGVSALLAMLNSCAAGVSVVNIDNGFGAGYLAVMINKDHAPE